MSNDVRPLLRDLAAIDHRAAVWCACLCARSVLHLADDVDERVQRAIETAEAWLWGEATAKACAMASDRVQAMVPAGLTANAARSAAAHAASAVVSPGVAVQSAEAAADAVSRDLLDALGGGIGDLVACERARTEHLAALDRLVCDERWPRSVPTTQQLGEAAASMAVAWDAVASRRPTDDLSLSELLSAHARAERLGLRWDDAVGRAIAEHAEDEAYAAVLLAVDPPR